MAETAQSSLHPLSDKENKNPEFATPKSNNQKDQILQIDIEMKSQSSVPVSEVSNNSSDVTMGSARSVADTPVSKRNGGCISSDDKMGDTPRSDNTPETKNEVRKETGHKKDDEQGQDLPESELESSELQEEPVPFVEGWNFVATLGEGAFGKVRLAVSTDNLQKVAIKTIDLQAHPTCKAAVNKEINIHRRLEHQHIITYYGDRMDDDQTTRYIFLEYCNGTELYDRIDPDKGLSHTFARTVFKQLLSAVDYIHQKGFTHRDIKPENILITRDDTVKLIDFGLATVFRFKSNTRQLAKRCGTPPYLAPEVLVGRPYDAVPAEIWSCGIVLVAMLAGELPWSEASCESNDWNDWLDKSPELESKTPWTKLDMDTLAFTRKILHHKPKKRLSIEGIVNHRWMDPERQTLLGSQKGKLGEISKRLQESRFTANNGNNLSVSKKRTRDEDFKSNHSGLATCSQPAAFASSNLNIKRAKKDTNAIEEEDDSLENLEDDWSSKGTKMMSSTQPLAIQNLYLSKSQIPAGFSQYLSQNNTQAYKSLFSHKSTKININLAKLDSSVIKELITVCDGLDLKILSYSNADLKLQPKKIKNRHNPLIFKIFLHKFNDDEVMLDFRLAKGDGLDFKRHFLSIKAAMRKFI